MSYSRISENLGWGTEKIRKILKTLQDIGAIDFYSGDSQGRTNLYAFPLETFGKKKSSLPPVKKNPDTYKADHREMSEDSSVTTGNTISTDEILKQLKTPKGEKNND